MNQPCAHFSATHPGPCVGVDTIEIQRDGLRRFTDVHSRFALAVASTSKSSKRATVLWSYPKRVSPTRRAGAIGQRQRVQGGI